MFWFRVFSPRFVLSLNYENGLCYSLGSSFLTNIHCMCLTRCSSNYLNREGRFMSKLLKTGGSKKKFRVFENPNPDLTFVSNKSKKHVNSRRINVLNKIFMQHITDLLATSDLSEILDKGILITKVEITPDFHYVNVFWTSKFLIENIDDMLYSVSRKLHHELSQLRVIGTVPKISFVKDTRQEKLIEVEKKIDQISMQIKDLNNEQSTLDDQEFEKCPEMINNVYGLEYDKIMKKIGFDMTSKNHFSRRKKLNSNNQMEDCKLKCVSS